MTHPVANSGEPFSILSEEDAMRLIHRPFFEPALPPILPPEVQSQLTGYLLNKVLGQKSEQSEVKRRIQAFHGQCRTLAFMRYGESPSAIILIPRLLEHMLPPATRQFNRSTKSGSPGASANYKPVTRKPRVIEGVESVGAKEHELAIEAVDARKVMLKLSPTRITEWGIELRLLGLRNLIEAPDFYLSWFNTHKLEVVTRTLGVHEILRGALCLACAVRKLIQRVKIIPPMYPLIHNQRGGNRYLLYVDQERLGSPADIHVLVYSGNHAPQLHGWSPLEKPTANEHKQALLLAATPDNRVRFYQPTEAQWAEWQIQWDKVWPGFIQYLSTNERSLIEKGVAAAQEQRRVSLDPPPPRDSQAP